MNKKIEFSDLFCQVISFLEKAEVDYLLIGGVAVGVWGRPRVTEDVDFIIFLPRENVKNLTKCAKSISLEFKEVPNPQLPQTSIFRISQGIYHADFIIASTEFEKSALQRKVKIKLFGKNVFVPTKEDLLLLKIIPARKIDIFDAENIAQRHSGKLDEKYLINWAEKLSDEAEDMRIYKEVKRLLKL